MADNTQPNEVTTIVIGEAITARDYASKEDKARAALQQENRIDRDSIVAKFGLPESIATICLLYNATGDPIKLVTSKNWNGQVRGFYPVEVGNGQWAVFVHDKCGCTAAHDKCGSTAAVVYRIKKTDEKEYDWMFSWDNFPSKKTHAYTEIREFGHFVDEVWPAVLRDLIEAGQAGGDTRDGYRATVSITDGPVAIYDALIQLGN